MRLLAPDFGLRPGEPAGAGMARIVRAQLDAAIARVEGKSGEDLGIAVHEARKGFKRTRAALRLARPQLGDPVYRRENLVLRNAGRQLSAARDAQVVLETLDALCERFPDDLPADEVARLRQALAERHEAAVAHLETQAPAVAAVAGDLRGVRERADGWTFQPDDLSALAAGFERIYRRGRRAHRDARKHPDTETFHELRKRAKDLWHAAQILEPAGVPKMAGVARRAHALADLIGEEHDVAVLVEAAAARPRDLDAKTMARLERVAKRRRATLRRKALRSSERIYRRKPRTMARRIRRAAAAA